MEDLYSEGYFLCLPPVNSMVEAGRLLIQDARYEVYILSAVLKDSKFALKEKNKWIDTYLPMIDPAHRIFTFCGDSKADGVPGGIAESDILLDDFSANLTQWSAVAVKVLNGINGTKGSWARLNGPAIRADWSPSKIKRAIDSM